MSHLAINLRNPAWPIALIREGVARWQQADGGHEDAEATAAPSTRGAAEDLFIAGMLQLIFTAARWSQALLGARPAAEIGLDAAIALAGATAQWPAFDALLLERAEARASGEWPAQDIQDVMQAHVGKMGAALKVGLLAEDDPLVDSPFHHALMHSERRLVERLVFDLLTGRSSRETAREHLARARAERVSYLEAVIGLVWADGRLDRAERRLVRALMGWRGFNPGERALLRRHLQGEPVDPHDIAQDVVDREDRRHLLRTLTVAALIDGAYSPEEKAWIGRLAAVFDVGEGELALLHAETAEQLRRESRLLRGLTVTGLVQRSMKASQRQVDGLVRRNLSAVMREVRETGDLLVLLRKSMREPLNDEEMGRVKAQLLDICRAVPALAIFAAPGGGVLLPVLIKVLPFSLFPSAFRHDTEKL